MQQGERRQHVIPERHIGILGGSMPEKDRRARKSDAGQDPLERSPQKGKGRGEHSDGGKGVEHGDHGREGNRVPAEVGPTPRDKARKQERVVGVDLGQKGGKRVPPMLPPAEKESRAKVPDRPRIPSAMGAVKRQEDLGQDHPRHQGKKHRGEGLKRPPRDRKHLGVRLRGGLERLPFRIPHRKVCQRGKENRLEEEQTRRGDPRRTGTQEEVRQGPGAKPDAGSETESECPVGEGPGPPGKKGGHP